MSERRLVRTGRFGVPDTWPGQALVGRLPWAFAAGLVAVLVALEATAIAVFVLIPSPYFELGMDWEFYRELGASWLVDGSYYRPHQLTGAYTFTTMVDNLYPPHALFLFVPFVYLPALAWWAIPAVILTLALRRLRPATWAWVLMLVLLAWPRSISAVLLGNTDIWVVAMLAAALTWGWPAVLLTIKPTFAPLILLGVGRPRQTALAGLALIVLATPGLPLWFDYAAALRNVQIDPSHPLGAIPLMLIPFVARLTSTRSRSSA